MLNKRDDRTNNTQRIQENVDHTLNNIHETEEMLKEVENEKTRKELEAKNRRREEAVNGMIEEMKDEESDKRNDYR